MHDLGRITEPGPHSLICPEPSRWGMGSNRCPKMLLGPRFWSGMGTTLSGGFWAPGDEGGHVGPQSDKVS